MSDKLADVKKARGVAVAKMVSLTSGDTFSAEDTASYDALELEVKAHDAHIERATKALALSVKSAVPVAGQERTFATVENDVYAQKNGLIVGGVMKMLAAGGGSIRNARIESREIYGEDHRVTRALNASNGSAGGFIIPPDYMNEIIELLRPAAVVRAAGPRNMPMPRGTMTLPGQGSAATATYGSESAPIGASQQTLNQIVATYKKLTVLVPVTNDMMRYADPAVDAFVRDDLVKVMALREDLAFLFGDGTFATPRGFFSFANGWAVATGGSASNFSTSANSVFAVGGNFLTSTAAYTLTTVAQELGGAMNKLDVANVPDSKRVWFMHPRSRNYLKNVQNSFGEYVYQEEVNKGTLFGYPIKTTTQVPTNLWDATGTNKDLSHVLLVEMTDAILLDSMQLELAVSREGTYIDGSGNTVSAFTNDQTIIRAIAEHDFQMRHDASVAVIQGVRWAPAI